MTVRKARLSFLILLITLSLFFLLQKNFLPGFSSKVPPTNNFKLLGQVINLIRNHYVDEANPPKTMRGAYKGLVNSLDVLSCYLDKKILLRYTQYQKAKLMDIGVVLYKRYGSFPMIIGILENSPAENHEIKIGDYISALDGHPTQVMSLTETYLYLKDKEDKPIKLKVIRGGKTQEISVQRASLHKESFSYKQVKRTSGILKIHQLYAPCVSKIEQLILPKLKSQKKSLIVDLRNCHEGDMEEARKFINFFIQAPSIGYFEKRGGVKEVLSCPEHAMLTELPLIIWINQATIGASEAVAGVLQKLKKARIIGLPTLGLVATQNFYSLEDGSALLLTSGIFHLPSGEILWEKGVKPDIKIDVKDQSFDIYLKKSLSSPH